MLRSLERSAVPTTAPAPTALLFYLADGAGGSSGPFTIEQLAGGAIAAETPVWFTGCTDWVQASTVPALAAVLVQAEPVPPYEEYQPISYAAPRTRSYSRAGRGAWRVASPSAVLLGLMLFFLPWIEVRCNFGGNNLVLLQQSGVQSIYGGASPSSQMEEYAREIQKQAEKVDKADAGKRVAEIKAAEAQKSGRIPPAFLVILAAAGAIVGGVAAIQPRRNRGALTTALVCTVGAAALLLLQVAVGFPVRSEMMSQLAKESAGASPGEPNPAAIAAAMFQFGMTPWFWLTITAMLAAAALAGAELMVAKRQSTPAFGSATPRPAAW